MNKGERTESYHLSRQSPFTFNETIEKITGALREEGFGIITSIDMKDILKKKINADFRNYIILGACNPGFAHDALLEEDKVGVFLPCNVVIQQHDNGEVEVSIIDPEEMVSPTNNLNLKTFATRIKHSMQQALRNMDR